PAARCPRAPLPGDVVAVRHRPRLPRVALQAVDTIRREEVDQLAALCIGEACAHADMLELAGIVEKTEEKRSDGGVLAVLVPAEAGNDAVAFALVLHLEHDA